MREWTATELILLLISLTVLAGLAGHVVFDIAQEMRARMRRRRIRRVLREGVADANRVQRETASEVHRLALRPSRVDAGAACGVGAGGMDDAAAVSADATLRTFQSAGRAYSGGGGISRAPTRVVCDRDSEYGSTTSLVYRPEERRVEPIAPWLAGRDV